MAAAAGVVRQLEDPASRGPEEQVVIKEVRIDRFGQIEVVLIDVLALHRCG
jgi:hypothetical protein